MGRARASTGTARLSAVAALASPCTAAAPSRNPNSIDPESPMNDRAGLKLWRRKPSAEPAAAAASVMASTSRSEEHTSELQSPDHLVCRLLLEKKKKKKKRKKTINDTRRQ